MTSQTQDKVKKHKGLVFPNDWDICKFKDAILIQNGQVDPKQDPYSNMYHIGLANIEKLTGRLLDVKTAKAEGVTSGKYFFQKGDVLYGKIRPELSKVYYAEFDGICSADIYPLKSTERIDSVFLKYTILDRRFYQYAVSTSVRTGLPKVNREDLGGYELILPPKKEQRKIALILNTWDKAIDLKEKLIEQKKMQKKGLTQKLLTGEVRLPGFSDKWEKVEFGDVLKFIRKDPIKNPQEYNLLTVKLHLKGIERTDKKPNVTTKGRPYYLREPNELLIGRQNFHNGGIGIVPGNMKNYVASNAISSLEAIKGNLKFYYYYLSNTNFYRRIGHIIGGTGQKEISESTMKKLKLLIPVNESEQAAIEKVLEIVDKEINLLEEELIQLKQQKKGLMQLLLTGKIRVKM
ncbi:restriction endonuclease subunit S [Bacillus cereus]|uniref:restriction endonuclease subunit S n=1 Tax=Bacillus cereus TaxID=1396 RepID=UPI0011A19596|nr:restriction endonuclease subunit S [Bacillus cereus]MCU5052769.1 restriction endonuclease subunit S [Bacillus cereus]MCU5192189.1 restriction endonuclease subunit S [Bacillus cereus]MCU5637782.1 restriction endonuclease subunit S [Bacillus cereus]